MFKALVRFKP